MHRWVRWRWIGLFDTCVTHDSGRACNGVGSPGHAAVSVRRWRGSGLWLPGSGAHLRVALHVWCAFLCHGLRSSSRALVLWRALASRHLLPHLWRWNKVCFGFLHRMCGAVGGHREVSTLPLHRSLPHLVLRRTSIASIQENNLTRRGVGTEAQVEVLIHRWHVLLSDVISDFTCFAQQLFIRAPVLELLESLLEAERHSALLV
mmetsp:Transcript_5400/g.13071  ORF Transcript_5400/g.13071 Transcript_5400/m.13071 type:complete len:204 (+) Transcript_5400:118-729(+)